MRREQDLLGPLSDDDALPVREAAGLEGAVDDDLVLPVLERIELVP